MNKKTLTREQLDRSCDAEGILHLEAKCHPDAGFLAHYVKDSSTLVLHCAKCSKYVDSVAVGPFGTMRVVPLKATVR